MIIFTVTECNDVINIVFYAEHILVLKYMIWYDIFLILEYRVMLEVTLVSFQKMTWLLKLSLSLLLITIEF
jgi:hypothetical protein